MAYDGRVIFCTRLDNSELERDLKKTEAAIEKAGNRLSKAKMMKASLVADAQKLEAELKAAEAKLLKYQKRFDGLGTIAYNPKTPEDRDRAIAEIPKARDAMLNQQSEVERLKKALTGVNKQISKYDLQIEEATGDLKENRSEAEKLRSQLTSIPAKAQKAFDTAEKKVGKLNSTILRVGASMLMYKVFSSVMQGVGEHIGKVLKTNKEYMAQLSQLKGALLTAFQPLYQVAVPAMMALLRIATAVVSVLANVLSILSGSNLSESAENAERLNKEAEAIENVGNAAEKARKQLMGFDEINKLESTDAMTGSGSSVDTIQPDFSAFDTAQCKAKIDEMTVYLSGSLLALGAILAFSGTNIPLGIGLMAVGAVGLAAVAKENWSAMSPGLKKAFGDVTAIVSGALLAVGAVLAFSGAATPLGIGLMIAGVAGMAASTAINWGSISETLRTEVGGIVAYLSTMALVLGAVLAFSGMNIPLGIALMVAGLAGTVATGTANWDKLKNKMVDLGNWLKGWLLNIIDYLNRTFEDGIIHGLATLIEDAITWVVNRIVDLFNWIGNNWSRLWSNLLGFFSSHTVVAGEVVSAPAVSYQSVPALARGAVLPANKPFLAMVGDQKHGTNIEAPLDTIKQAVAEVIGQRASTDELLRELIETVRGIEVGDETIGRAAARYTRNISRARGL